MAAFKTSFQFSDTKEIDMKKWFLTLTALVCLMALAVPAWATQNNSQNILIKVGSGTNDLHPPFMAFKIGKLLLEKNQEVTVFLNLEAVRLADKGQPLNLKWGTGRKDLLDLFEGFVQKGGKIVICPHCAKAAGVKQENLRSGAIFGNEAIMADLFLRADKVIDY